MYFEDFSLMQTFLILLLEGGCWSLVFPLLFRIASDATEYTKNPNLFDRSSMESVTTKW